MGADMNDVITVGKEHHCIIFGAGFIGKYLGVPGILFITRQMHGFLVNRSGNHGIDLTAQGKID